MVDILHKANPWAGEDCGRKGCQTKKDSGKSNSQDCRRRNCVYKTECLTCSRRQDEEVQRKYGQEGKKRVEEEKRKLKRFLYIGETNRSPYERALEHQNDVGACKTSSHMLRHLLEVHEEEEKDWKMIKFGMRIIRSTRSAFECQIMESVEIQKARKTSNILNAKSEYNRCALPRLTSKLGEKDLDRWRKEDREEQEKEASLEEKIRIRKKNLAKERGRANRRIDTGQPQRKKLRTEGKEEEGGIEERAEEDQKRERTILIETPKKRKVLQEEKERKKTPKKRRRNQDIKRIASLRRTWSQRKSKETTKK